MQENKWNQDSWTYNQILFQVETFVTLAKVERTDQPLEYLLKAYQDIVIIHGKKMIDISMLLQHLNAIY